VHAVLDDGLAGFGQGQLPPWSTAMSTITEPGFMALTVSSVISTGALRPGIRAVVMMMSACLARSCTSSAWRFIQSAASGGHSRPRPGRFPFLVGQEGHVDELGAQRFDLLLHRRTHVGRLDHRAQALGRGDGLQAGHATPMISMRAAFTVPAAVISMGMKRW
jgi:hypothetical protein